MASRDEAEQSPSLKAGGAEIPAPRFSTTRRNRQRIEEEHSFGNAILGPNGRSVLRKLAEDVFANHVVSSVDQFPADPRHLAHELCVHRLELEILGQELHKTHQELQVAQDQSVDLCDFVPVGLLSVDGQGFIRDANRAVTRFFRKPRARLVGLPLLACFEVENRKSLRVYLARCLAGGDPVATEIVLTPRGQSPVALRFLAERDEERSTGVSVYRMAIVDLTEQRRAEEVAEVARARSLFLANVSHELRTPMNAILGMTELALDEQISDDARDYLRTVKDSAHSLLSLLNDILDFSRIDAGKFPLESRPFGLRAMLDDLMKLMRARAREKDLEIVCEVAQDAPDGVLGDEMRLRQILLNLIGNAIKFTPQGRITVAVGVLAGSVDEVELEFRVADTGVGIAPEDQYRIFQPFIQAQASNARNSGGTGLGLAIVANLVSLMRGQIGVKSEVGEGTEFAFTARFGIAANVPVRAPQVDSPQEFNGRSLRVLVAEDLPANQKLVATVLTKRGHQVTIAVNGNQAVENVVEQEFDLVLMDVQMPILNGFQATERIRKMRPDLPIVAMTAHAMKGDQERCLAAGMDAYIAKPIDRQELIRVVERLAQGKGV